MSCEYLGCDVDLSPLRHSSVDFPHIPAPYRPCSKDLAAKSKPDESAATNGVAAGDVKGGDVSKDAPSQPVAVSKPCF